MAQQVQISAPTEVDSHGVAEAAESFLAGLAAQRHFPSADLVDVAAGMIPAWGPNQGREGPTWRITVAPGVVGVCTRDEARYERTQERQRAARCAAVDALAAYLAEEEQIPDREPTRTISGWSAKSRRNMVKTLGELDYAPMFTDTLRLLAMLTLTYPGDWLTVAPNGKAVKRHLDQLRKRYERAFGERLIAVWKLEFQRRGAPHFHLLMAPPHHAAGDGRYFREWISQTWAAIVGHPDPEERRKHEAAGTGIDHNEGLRASDPRRVAVYFTKHGAFAAKEYQHCVPEEWQAPGQGPGRFWGYWGVAKKIAARQVDPDTGAAAGRTIRRWSAAQQVTREVNRPRTRGGRPVSKYADVIGLAGAQLVESRRTRYRKTRTKAVRCQNGRGWVSVNDGPGFAMALALVLLQRREDNQRAADRAELERAGIWWQSINRARRLQPSARRDALISRMVH